MAALICFGIAAIAFGGLILRNDQVGRLLFGVAWGTLGVVWFGKYLLHGRASKDPDSRDDGSPGADRQ
jgi:hypothetical protein